MDWQQLLKYRKQALIFSAIIILIALFGFIYRGGLLYGIEFTGGFRIMLEYSRPIEAEHVGGIRDHFDELGTEIQINTFEIDGTPRGLMMTARGQEVVERLTERLYDAGRAGEEGIFEELGALQEEYFVPGEALRDNFGFATEDDRIDLTVDGRSTIRSRVESLVNDYVLAEITRHLRRMYEAEDKIDLNWAGVSEIRQWLVDRQLAGITGEFERMLEEESLNAPGDIEPLLEKFRIPSNSFWEVFSLEAGDARLNLRTEVTPGNFEEIMFEEFFEGRYESVAEQIVDRRNSLGLFRSPAQVLQTPALEQLYRPALEECYLSPFVAMSSEMISPAIGADLIGQAVMAIFISLFGILAYLYIRFELTYSLGAIAAILHDITLTVGLITLLGVQFDVPVVAAILTVIGYSLNDTIVNFDRVRENKTLMGYKANWYEVINRSVYEVLNRTIVTSLTTFIAVLFLYLYGGVALNNFALTLLIGVIAGTYSSVFISNVVLLKLQNTLRST